MTISWITSSFNDSKKSVHQLKLLHSFLPPYPAAKIRTRLLTFLECPRILAWTLCQGDAWFHWSEKDRHRREGTNRWTTRARVRYQISWSLTRLQNPDIPLLNVRIQFGSFKLDVEGLHCVVGVLTMITLSACIYIMCAIPSLPLMLHKANAWFESKKNPAVWEFMLVRWWHPSLKM